MIHDKPKESKDKDSFRRAGFSLRIANLIRNRSVKESIAIGINGPWGEGKTTVLNFVAEELKKDHPKTIVVRFNPWMFNEEEKLLKTFFVTVTKALSSSLSSSEKKQGMREHEMKEDLKGIGKAISEYSESLFDGIPVDVPGSSIFGKTAKKVLNRLTTTELEDRKNKLSELMRKYERKIIILIDDIDRLSKDEVYSIFRLVKLTADFDYFVYLLAYDADRVAEAIGNRFGNDKQAGNHFLEKIVQVPINLPEILFEDIAKLFFNSLTEILEENKIQIREQELRRFQDIFTSSLQFKIDTPRKAIRYSNTIQFSLPLMSGEVNVVDLMLLEGLKVFFSDHYEFVKGNYSLLTSGIASQEDSRGFKDRLEQIYGSLDEKLSDKEKETVRNMLMELFPTLQRVWKNTVLPPEFYAKMTSEKRIVSREYFNRYFTFSLADHEISDNSFDELIEKIRLAKPEEVAHLLKDFTLPENIGSMVHKLRVVENKFSENESIALAKGLALIGDKFPDDLGFFGFDFSPFSQAAILISRLLTNIPGNETRARLTFELTELATSFEFASEIVKWISSTTHKQVLVHPDDLAIAREKLRNRCLTESGEKPFYLKFPDQSPDIIRNWSISDRVGLVGYLKDRLKDTESVSELLLSVVGKSYSSSFKGPLISDLEDHDYKWMSDSIGSDWLYEILLNSVGESFSQDVVISTKFTSLQNKENLIKQFMFWHEKASDTQWEIKKLKRELIHEDVANTQLSPEVSAQVIKTSVVPLLRAVEQNCLEFLEFFNSYDRDINVNVGGTVDHIADKGSDLTQIEVNIITRIQRANTNIQSLEYGFLLRGYKKSLSNSYMRADIKFQFNEYTYMIVLNNNHAVQKTLAYEKII